MSDHIEKGFCLFAMQISPKWRTSLCPLNSMGVVAHESRCNTNQAWKTTISHTQKYISHLVTSLSTSCPSHCMSQVVNKFGTTICNNLVDIVRLVARLFQQVRYSHDIAVLLQPCVVNLETFLLYIQGV
jgi:hypothetical protein